MVKGTLVRNPECYDSAIAEIDVFLEKEGFYWLSCNVIFPSVDRKDERLFPRLELTAGMGGSYPLKSGEKTKFSGGHKYWIKVRLDNVSENFEKLDFQMLVSWSFEERSTNRGQIMKQERKPTYNVSIASKPTPFVEKPNQSDCFKCYNCGANNANKPCSKCKKATYCNQKCLKEHQQIHKHVCLQGFIPKAKKTEGIQRDKKNAMIILLVGAILAFIIQLWFVSSWKSQWMSTCPCSSESLKAFSKKSLECWNLVANRSRVYDVQSYVCILQIVIVIASFLIPKACVIGLISSLYAMISVYCLGWWVIQVSVEELSTVERIYQSFYIDESKAHIYHAVEFLPFYVHFALWANLIVTSCFVIAVLKNVDLNRVKLS